MKTNGGRKGRPQNQDEKIRSRRRPTFFRIAQKNRDSGIGTAVAPIWDMAGAQYREATRAKSNADFISKIEGALQELEESEYWLELLRESGLVPEQRLVDVKKETGESKGIFVSIVRKMKARTKTPRP